MPLLGSQASGLGNVDSAGETSPRSGGLVQAQLVLSRAQSLLGPTVTKVMGTEFDASFWYQAGNVGTGSSTLSTAKSGGVLNLASGAVAGGNGRIQPAGAPSLIENPTTSLWYLRARWKLLTAVDANSYVGLGAIGPGFAVGPQIFVGALGLRSVANFSYDIYSNALVAVASGATSVALDLSYHVLEMVNNGVNWSFYIDGVRVVNITLPALVTNPVTPALWAANGATAADRGASIDDLWCCTEQPT